MPREFRDSFSVYLNAMSRKKRKPLVDTVVVICEGASENGYLQELNRFLREHKIPLAFAPNVIGSGVYKAAVNRYRDVRRENRHAEIVIWVDRDIYMNSQKKLYENKPDAIPDFLFSIDNRTIVSTVIIRITE